MRPSRWLLAVVVLVTALLLQVTVLSRLPLPGATPDLVLLVVVALGLADGSAYGAGCGFGVGLALDLVPPADHTVGMWAFVLTVVGYAAGYARPDAQRSAVVPVAVAAAAAAGSLLLYAALAAVASTASVDGGAVLRLLPTAVLYDVVLAPFVVSGVVALRRQLEDEPAR